MPANLTTLVWNGERLFQAAKFGTEMQYQHLVFEEFARTIQPNIDVFIPHQANLRIINATAERLGLRNGNVIINIDRYGNTTAATIPLAMNTAIEQGKLKKGSLVMLASVGAGFTVGATLLRWAF